MEANRYQTKIVTIPNILSLFRLMLIPAIVWLYVKEEAFDLAGYLLILSGVTDLADGFIARRFRMISNLGRILDPFADKMTQAAMLICLLSRFPLMLLPFVLMLIKEPLVTFSGYLVFRRTGQVLGANWHGKLATCQLYGTMYLHIFWEEIPILWSHLTIFCCAGMILLSFVLYEVRNLRILLEQRRKPAGAK